MVFLDEPQFLNFWGNLPNHETDEIVQENNLLCSKTTIEPQVVGNINLFPNLASSIIVQWHKGYASETKGGLRGSSKSLYYSWKDAR